MNLREYINHFFKEAGHDVPGNWVLSRPKDPSHGHLSANAPFLVKGVNPRETAAKLAEHCLSHPDVEKAEPAGAGFVNFTMKPSYWHAVVGEVLKAGKDYGKQNIGAGEHILLEYISANPTGPLHAGHARIAVLGDAVGSLLKAVGYNVVREFYVNDAGNQIKALGKSIHMRYEEALGLCTLTDDDFGADGYRGAAVKELGETLAKENGKALCDKPIDFFCDYGVQHFCELFKKDLQTLHVEMDQYVSEKRDVIAKGWVEKAKDKLPKACLYEGTLEKPKGHDSEEWEPRPQLLFKSTDYGDDQDRALQKSDGTWTYFAGDIAYHAYKLDRVGADGYLVNIFGADHSGYVKRIQAVVKALGHKKPLEVPVCQLVNFSDNGQPVRMSKRTGNMVTLAEVAEQVGADATRFMMLWRHHNMTIDFDFAQVMAESQDNPIFYVQYAHARICTVLGHAETLWPGISKEVGDVSELCDPYELALMQRMSEWPDCLQGAALSREPNRIPQYLYTLASDFHSLWAQGKQHKHLRFIDDTDKPGTLNRLTLLRAVATVLAGALGLLRIEAKERL